MYQTIYLVVKTGSFWHSGTKSQPVLILHDNGYDFLHHTFELENGLEKNSTEILSIDVSNRNIPTYLDYIRLGINGADQWRPDTVVIWGEKKPEHGGELVPIGIRMWGDDLSTDENEGRLSMPIGRAYQGGSYSTLKRFMLMITNAKRRHSGTKSEVKIRIKLKEGPEVVFPVPAGSLAEDGASYLDIRFTPQEFRQADLRSISVEIEGDDAWQPERFMVFGLDTRNDGQEIFIPFCIYQGLERARFTPNEYRSQGRRNKGRSIQNVFEYLIEPLSHS